MRDQDDGGAKLITAAPKQIEDLCLHGHIERGRRLVCDDKLRIEHEGHRDDDTLFLAARELVRVEVHALPRIRNPDLVENFDRLRACLAFAVLAVRSQSLRDLPANRVHRIECCRRLLEHHRDVHPANRAQSSTGQLDHVAACDHDSTTRDGRLRQQAQDGFRRHRLAAAALTNDS